MHLDDIFQKQVEMSESAYASVKKQDEQVYLISFMLNSTRFAVPITQIKEIVDSIQITPFPVENGLYMGVVNLHGHLVPVLDSKKLVQNHEADAKQNQMRMIVCENLYKATFIVNGYNIKKIAASNDTLNPDNKIFSRIIKLNDEILQLLDFMCANAADVFGTANNEVV